ncbi:MAG: hypothetical protein AUJ92_21070 [Armatimonadetes bacterium CG2_30_59_28]|nr:MAG: hypothetical protein AUJ92_21070 [Armatimonadetes bacterium CG2_30_59_28]
MGDLGHQPHAAAQAVLHPVQEVPGQFPDHLLHHRRRNGHHKLATHDGRHLETCHGEIRIAGLDLELVGHGLRNMLRCDGDEYQIIGKPPRYCVVGHDDCRPDFLFV